ncbi:MAG: hypothetical protein GQ578_07455, partial [Desulfuromonadaceae bacterium]|nr:hypothetical protein [Desulfuromonadaceae bacterium]
VGIAVADLDNDGRQETAIAMETYLLITQIAQGKMVEEGRIDLPPGEKLLSIDSLDLDRNGSQELYLTAVRDQRLISMCIEYTDSGYQITINHIPWFLRANELPGEGRVLLGQSMGDYEQPFHQQPFRVTREGNSLQKGQEFTLPAHANVYGFNSLSDSSNQQFIAYLTKGDYLKVVSAAGTELWESSEYFGGSETNFYNKEDLDGDLINPIYIQQRILRTPAGEILVSQNDGTRVMQRFRMFKNSRIIALNWNGFALQESWRTSGLNGYLADFILADADNDGSDELVMVVKFKHKTILNPARSTVVIYELNN